MYYCSFCGKDEEHTAYLMCGPQVCICESCILDGVGTLIQSLRKTSEELSESKIETKPQWIEASAVDPRDGKEYFARVDGSKWKNKDQAYIAAQQRAEQLAARKKEKK